MEKEPLAQAIYTNCNGDVITETDEVTVIFTAAPTITSSVSDYHLCDNDGDGSETFDLTSKYLELKQFIRSNPNS